MQKEAMEERERDRVRDTQVAPRAYICMALEWHFNGIRMVVVAAGFRVIGTGVEAGEAAGVGLLVLDCWCSPDHCFSCCFSSCLASGLLPRLTLATGSCV